VADRRRAPSGTVTFLFTDIEGSTRWWQDRPIEMRSWLAEHDAHVRSAIESGGGHVFKHSGDGVLAAFSSANDAIDAAVDAQSRLVELPILVRMGLHSGEADERDGDYFGPSLNRCARLMAIAHGGQILLSRPTAALAGERTDLVDLGEHHLRDLAQPEHVFQVGSGRFPPLRTRPEQVGNLQAPLTSFVGRSDELARIGSLLHEHRIVTITGAGGVGKTRLATHASDQLSVSFADGVWLIELAPIGDPDMLPLALASTLGVRPRPATSVLEGVQQHLAQKQMLLVFDNCEHLLLAVGRAVEALTRSCPGVRVLATSRESLAIDGEQSWPLAPLDSATAGIELFVDRARAVLPSFELTGDDERVVGEICAQLDGMPLAIELAAARVASLDPSEILLRLDERFRLLTGGRRTAVARHQTLRSVVDWSYGLLDDTTRSVFDQLSVFAGGFTLDAAEAVVGSDASDPTMVVDSLSNLVAKSMVVADPSTQARRRYRLLETLRQYGEEQLESAGLAEAARRRQAEHMADFTAAAARGWRGPEEQRWRHRLLLELDNLRVAVSWAIAVGDADLAGRLIGPLADQANFYPSWGIGSLAEGVLTVPGIDTHPMLPGVLVAHARATFHRGAIADAVAAADRAVAAGLEPGRVPVADAWTLAGGGRVFLGDYDARRRLLTEGMEVAQRSGDPFELGLIASVAAPSFSDDVDAGHSCAERAEAAVGGRAGPEVWSYVACNIGCAYIPTDRDRARRLLEQSVALRREVGSTSLSGIAYGYLAYVYAASGDEAKAMSTAREGIIDLHAERAQTALAVTMEHYAVGLSVLGHHSEAAFLFAVIDEGLISNFAVPGSGWQHDLRQNGRDVTYAALPVGALEAVRQRVRRMNVDQIVGEALTDIDQLLEQGTCTERNG